MKGKLTISRPMYGDGREAISIKVKDSASRTSFLEVEIGMADFAKCLTGCAEIECDISVKGLCYVGMTKETKTIDILCPSGLYGEAQEEAATLLARKHEIDGWICDGYWRNQKSFFQKNGETWAMASFYRYVDTV